MVKTNNKKRSAYGDRPLIYQSQSIIETYTLYSFNRRLSPTEYGDCPQQNIKNPSLKRLKPGPFRATAFLPHLSDISPLLIQKCYQSIIKCLRMCSIQAVRAAFYHINFTAWYRLIRPFAANLIRDDVIRITMNH